MEPNTPKDSQEPQSTDKTEHHKGLADKLKEALFRKEPNIDEGSDTLNNTAEHEIAEDELEARRAAQDTAEAEEARLREQALSELGGSSGVVTGGPEAIEQKMAEIKARNVSESGPSTPAA